MAARAVLEEQMAILQIRLDSLPAAPSEATGAKPVLHLRSAHDSGSALHKLRINHHKTGHK